MVCNVLARQLETEMLREKYLCKQHLGNFLNFCFHFLYSISIRQSIVTVSNRKTVMAPKTTFFFYNNLSSFRIYIEVRN